MKGRILIVDYRVENLDLLSSILTRVGYEVKRAINGAAALIGVQSASPDLILLDINMPDINGYEVCRQLKQNSKYKEIPIVFTSNLDNGLDKIKAFSAGGIDYISKPFEMIEVLSRVENHLQINAARTKLKYLNIELEQRVKERTAELTAAKHALEQENMEHQKVLVRLEHMAWHDPLTGLPNRDWLMRQLQKFIEQARQDDTYQFAVLFLNCDRFKVINDSLGYIVGDQLLVEIAHRITNSLPTNATISRFSADGFIILLEKITHLNEAEDFAKKIQDILSSPVSIKSHEIFMSASIGIVLGNSEVQYPEDLVRDADIAMYQAKTLGKARYYVFSKTLYSKAQKRLQLETDLRRAIERQEFFLNYQPIISLRSGKIEGFEALIRWNHPIHGLIAPADFIPVAEETGLIVLLGEWVLEEACRQFQIWKTELEADSSNNPYQTFYLLKISVNVSARQFSQHGLIDAIDQILEKTDFDGKNLTLEITESVLMNDPQLAGLILKELRDRHIQIAIDDFGTGYSSLSYLHRFSVDTFKIDRSFTSRISSNRESFRILEAMACMAQSLGITVVAEGIESLDQALQLQRLGCNYGQGYWFSKPLDSASALQLLLSKAHFEMNEIPNQYVERDPKSIC
jgi:diguanylate cyclase (GGDEF)-like protein